MGNSFLSATANFEDFIKLSSAQINNHVQKNNEGILKKAFNFFQNDNKILLINGFSGVGKKQIAEHLVSYLDKDTIVLRFVCTESATLDDVLLTFYKTLKKKTSVKESADLEAIESLSDKVEYFISTLNMKFVPVFFNFDSIQSEHKADILNYIFALSEKENMKTLIVAKTFDTDIIPEQIKHVKLMVKALSKELFEVYLREFGIKVTPGMLDQLYRLSRGYFYSACLCIKIMINQELSINDLIVQYTNSGLKFDDFLAKTYYRLIVGTTKSAFNLFVKLRHGLNIKILQTIGSYPENILKTLNDNFYIYKKGDLFYPSEFLKQQLAESIGDEISPKRLVGYYEKQIALPPEERDFTISRASMQNEIAFYTGTTTAPQEETPTQDSAQNEAAEQQHEKEPEKKTIPYQTMTISELIEAAQESYKTFNYLRAVDILTFVLSKKDSITGSDLLYETYTLLANTYSKLAKWNYALYYFNLLERHYSHISDKENMHKMQFEKAYIYYHCYRIIDAIKILKMLLSVTKNNELICRSNIILGNVALSASNKPMAIQYYKEGIDHLTDESDIKIRMELYFKFAILSDEVNDINNAIEYYQKCIQTNDTESKYCALAYSNLADLFYDNDLFDEAKDCFEKAYNSDKLLNNDYGMYYSLTKLIELTDKKEKDEIVKLAEEAKEHAVKSQDYNAIINSTIKLGDIYYDYPEPEKALTQYLELYKRDIDDFGEYNVLMVKSRLEDIKARLGKEKFEELVPDYE